MPEVVAIIVPAVLIITIFVVAPLVIWRLRRWQEIKRILRRYFCSCCPPANLNCELVVQFDNKVIDPGNFEPTVWRECEMHKEEETDQMGPLKPGDFASFITCTLQTVMWGLIEGVT